jgi:hypothetical protein
MGFLSPTTLEARRSDFPELYLLRFRSTLRVSHPLSALLPAWPSGLVSCRWRPWGFPFRAFPSQGAVPPLGGRCPHDVHRTPSVPHVPIFPRDTGRSPPLTSGRLPELLLSAVCVPAPHAGEASRCILPRRGPKSSPRSSAGSEPASRLTVTVGLTGRSLSDLWWRVTPPSTWWTEVQPVSGGARHHC